jgi:hypothetical protein
VFSGSSELELVIISIAESNDSVPLTLALFYRPPSSPYCVLDKLLTVLCTHIDPPCLANLILLGDFNINFFDTQWIGNGRQNLMWKFLSFSPVKDIYDSVQPLPCLS